MPSLFLLVNVSPKVKLFDVSSRVTANVVRKVSDLDVAVAMNQAHLNCLFIELNGKAVAMRRWPVTAPFDLGDLFCCGFYPWQDFVFQLFDFALRIGQPVFGRFVFALFFLVGFACY